MKTTIIPKTPLQS